MACIFNTALYDLSARMTSSFEGMGPIRGGGGHTYNRVREGDGNIAECPRQCAGPVPLQAGFKLSCYSASVPVRIAKHEWAAILK